MYKTCRKTKNKIKAIDKKRSNPPNSHDILNYILI